MDTTRTNTVLLYKELHAHVIRKKIVVFLAWAAVKKRIDVTAMGQNGEARVSLFYALGYKEMSRPRGC